MEICPLYALCISALISLKSYLSGLNTGYEFGGPLQEEWKHTGMDPGSNAIIQKLVKNRLCDFQGRTIWESTGGPLCGQIDNKGIVA